MELPPNFNLEVTDLQCDDMIKDTYQKKNSNNFTIAFQVIKHSIKTAHSQIDNRI